MLPGIRAPGGWRDSGPGSRGTEALCAPRWKSTWWLFTLQGQQETLSVLWTTMYRACLIRPGAPRVLSLLPCSEREAYTTWTPGLGTHGSHTGVCPPHPPVPAVSPPHPAALSEQLASHLAARGSKTAGPHLCPSCVLSSLLTFQALHSPPARRKPCGISFRAGWLARNALGFPSSEASLCP